MPSIRWFKRRCTLTKQKHLNNWVYRKLMDQIVQERHAAEKTLRQNATQEALRTRSGLGSITDANFHTPAPWRYENSRFRKLAWFFCRAIDRVFYHRRGQLYVLPLRTDSYLKGEMVIFHSGVKVKRCEGNETVTFSRPVFNPFPYHP